MIENQDPVTFTAVDALRAACPHFPESMIFRAIVCIESQLGMGSLGVRLAEVSVSQLLLILADSAMLRAGERRCAA